MTRDEIYARLKSIFEDFFAVYSYSADENESLNKAELPPFGLENHIIKTYGGDSLDLIEIVMAVEDEFNIEISDEVAEKLETVGQYLDYLTPILADRK